MIEQTLANSITIDEKDCAFYTKACANWWNPNGALKPLHTLNNIGFEYLKTTITQPENLEVLDAGCGGGIFSELMTKLGCNVTGIDINLNVIRVARQHANQSNLNIKYRFESVENHALENEEKYDVIILSYVLQHAQNHTVILKNCVKMLKPGGYMYISAVGKTAKAWVNFKIWERILRIMPIGAHNWNNFIKCSTVEEFLTKNGCSIKYRRGFHYNIIKSQWFWCNNVDTVYFIQAVKDYSC